MPSVRPSNPFYLNTQEHIYPNMDPDIAWEEFSSQGSKRVEEVRKGMTSINGKLDALLQLANENNVNSARTAEIVPQVMGDTAAEEAQAAEMTAMGGMSSGMPPEGAPPEDVPPEAMGDMPPEEAPMPEGGAPAEGGAPIGEDSADEPMPPVDMPPADMGEQPAEVPMDEPMPEEGEVPPEAGGLGISNGFGDIDWAAYSIDNAYEDFEEALKEEAKEALDAGDTQRVASITQVMDAMRMIWAQSGVSDGMGAVQPEQAMATGVDGMPAPDMMKSEGEEVTEEVLVDAVKAEEAPVEGPVEKADDMAGDIASGETAGGESVEAVAASDACAEEDVKKGVYAYGPEKYLRDTLPMVQQAMGNPTQLREVLMDAIGNGVSRQPVEELMMKIQQTGGDASALESYLRNAGFVNPVPKKARADQMPNPGTTLGAPVRAPEPDSYTAPSDSEPTPAVASAGMTRYDPNTGETTPEPSPNGLSPSASVAGHMECDPAKDKTPNQPVKGNTIDLSKSEGAPLPSFKSMMDARAQGGNPYDCSADEDMLRGVKMGQVYKSESGAYMVINSSRPNVASAVGMQKIIEPQDLRKSEANMRVVEEDNPLKKALRNDWDNYMAYKQTDSF